MIIGAATTDRWCYNPLVGTASHQGWSCKGDATGTYRRRCNRSIGELHVIDARAVILWRSIANVVSGCKPWAGAAKGCRRCFVWFHAWFIGRRFFFLWCSRSVSWVGGRAKSDGSARVHPTGREAGIGCSDLRGYSTRFHIVYLYYYHVTYKWLLTI
jgi:hypothetical protein